MIASGYRKHVGHELRCDRSTRVFLLVHPRIRITGDDSGDAPRRGSLAGRYEDEEFHEVVVDVATGRLDNENIFVSDGLGDLDVDLAVGELFDLAGRQGYIEPDGKA